MREALACTAGWVWPCPSTHLPHLCREELFLKLYHRTPRLVTQAQATAFFLWHVRTCNVAGLGPPMASHSYLYSRRSMAL